jgi:chemotaxis response regulator CheB
MAEPLKVLIVDDSAIYRSLVQGCLRDMPELRCVGTAHDGATIASRGAAPGPDPARRRDARDERLEAMKLRKLLPDAGIIMVSSLTTEARTSPWRRSPARSTS